MHISEKPRSSNQDSAFGRKKAKSHSDENSKSSKRDKVFSRKKTEFHSDENSRTATANFLLFHDERYKVSQTHPIYHSMGEDALKIVEDTFDRLEDKKFHAKILPSGSFFEDLKVGKPDEFDFLAQITSLSGKKCDMVPSDRPGFVHVAVKEPFYHPWKNCTALVCEHEIRADQCEYCANINPSDVGCTIILAPEKVQEEFREIVDNALEEVPLPENWRHRGVEEPNCGGFRRHGPANMFLFYYDTPDGQSIKVSLDITLSIGLGTPIDTESINFFPMYRIPPKHRFQPWYKDVLENGVEGEYPLQLIPLYSKLHVRTGCYGYKDCWRVSCSLVEREFLNRFHPGTGDSLPKRCIRLCKWLRDKYLTEDVNERKKENIRDINNSMAKSLEQNRVSKEYVNNDQAPQVNCPNDGSKMVQAGISGLDRPNINLTSSDTGVHKQTNQAEQDPDRPLKENLYQPCLADTAVRETHTVAEHGGETTTNPDYKTLPETEREIQSVNYADFITDEDIPELLNNFKKVFKPAPSSFRSSTFRCMDGFPVYSERVLLRYLNKKNAYAPYKRTGRKKHKRRRSPRPGLQTTEVSVMQLNPHSEEYYGPKAYVSSIEIKTIIMYLMERHPFPEQWTENQIPSIIIKVFKFIHHMYLEDGCVLNFFFDVPVIAPQPPDTRETAIKKLAELIDKMGSRWIPIQEEFPRTNFTDNIPRFRKFPPSLYSRAMKLCQARRRRILLTCS